jgi:hypothetical protein
MKKYIKVKTDFVGFHRWKDAPDSTAFLRDYHRHIFYVGVSIEVSGSDRELEFFEVKNTLEEYTKAFEGEYFDMSCEHIAERIYGFLIGVYGEDRKYTIEVSEDNESSGILVSE